jgi:hypothetical protein
MVNTLVRDNKKRLFVDLVSLEAWHDPFTVSDSHIGVFVEVSFSQARMGGDDDEIPFTFRLRLKRALLSIEAEHPLRLQRETVARDIPQGEVKLTAIRQAKVAVKANLSAKAALSPRSLAMNIATGLEAGAERSQERLASIEKAIPEILCMPKPAGGRAYMWELEPTFADFLEGQPWEPTTQPRLAFSGFRKTDPLEPAIQVRLSCKVEDLAISDIQHKDKSVAARIKRAGRRKVNEAAAIQHIKRVLHSHDLVVSDTSNRFKSVVLGDVLAQPERP